MRILSLAPLGGPGVDALSRLGELEIDPWSEQVPFRILPPDALIERARDADILIVEADFVTREVIEGTTLRIIGSCRGDPNNVDVDAATRARIPVLHAPGRNATAVAELTVCLMLALIRDLVPADADVRAGRWIVDGVLPQQRHAGRELSSMTVGIVGYGAVGRAVARMLRVLARATIAYDPFVDPSAMDADGVTAVADIVELCARSDIVSVHAPLSDATRGLVGARALAALRPGSYLVNTARYGIVDEEPLLAALQDGRLAGAAFDHFENEFLATDHPLVAMRNVVLTPHIGGTTRETIERHTMLMARGIEALLRGDTPDNIVNPRALA